ncbi:MAG TPA: hypothetical protein PKA55_17545 [Rhodoblastus sp.]|nr:hypothetical protein [Rhodoblastus sp.]
MSKIRLILAFCGALAAGAVMMSAPAAATPTMDPFAGAATQSTSAPTVEKARIVCNAWGRCWRTRPRYYAPRFYYGRPMYRRHYHRRHWRRW